jgi:hypothetical protein
MRLTKKQMRWNNIDRKLKVGVGIAKRQEKASDVHKFGSAIEKIAYSSARTTHQLEGFGDAGIVEQLQSGELLPDEMFGWSTKTILVILLALLLFKVKKLQGA